MPTHSYSHSFPHSFFYSFSGFIHFPCQLLLLSTLFFIPFFSCFLILNDFFALFYLLFFAVTYNNISFSLLEFCMLWVSLLVCVNICVCMCLCLCAPCGPNHQFNVASDNYFIITYATDFVIKWNVYVCLSVIIKFIIYF